MFNIFDIELYILLDYIITIILCDRVFGLSGYADDITASFLSVLASIIKRSVQVCVNQEGLEGAKDVTKLPMFALCSAG